MKLSEVVPWGRSFEEYRLMFGLTEADLGLSLLGCGDGPASFNAEMSAMGRNVTSIDPIYALSKEEIRRRIAETYEPILSQVKQNPHLYNWQHFADAEALGQARLAAMDRFLQDFEAGLAGGRYLPEALPALNFADGQFQLSLCSHLLFLYSEQLSLEFHLASIQELLRVSAEVRIFPVVNLACERSAHVEPVQTYFRSRGCSVSLETVPYEFQKGGSQMLRLCP